MQIRNKEAPMSLDPYRLCPCGSGKKIKFCCSKDILSDLDKVIRSIEGDQRAAALDHLTKLIEDKGDRPALLSLKASLQLSMSTLEDAAATIDRLSEISPNSSATLALQAQLNGERGEVDAAIDELQRSFEYADGTLAGSIYPAIMAIVENAIEEGRFLTARAHLMLLTGFSNGNDRAALSLLLRIDSARDLTCLVKEDYVPEVVEDGAPWVGEYRAAMLSSNRGNWRAACESLVSLSQKVPRQPAIVRSIAILQGWLGQEQKAAQTWHEYAALEGVPQDRAVEAESLAQILDDDQMDTIEKVRVTYAVNDMDRLMERLLSDRRFVRAPAGANDLFAAPDQPPPRGLFVFLDRPVSDDKAATQPAEFPMMLGIVAVFGKETDREARLELLLDRDPAFEIHKKSMCEVGGEWLGDVKNEERHSETSLDEWVFTTRWHPPEGCLGDDLQNAARVLGREALLNRWPTLPRRALGGKSPRDAAAEPAYRIRLLAAILSLELAPSLGFTLDDTNQLRQHLGLPTAELIDPTGKDIHKIPLCELQRLEIAKVAGDQLAVVLQRALVKGLQRTVYGAATEMLSRGLTNAEINKPSLYKLAVENAPDSRLALKWVLEAEQSAEAEKKSPAPWLVTELSLRIVRAEFEDVNRVMNILRTRHLREPGIAQQVAEVLARFGLLPQARGAEDGQPAAEAAPQAAPETKKLWTPESAAAPAGQSPSKLWLPGMD
jgi:hypothetical protein